MSKLYIAYGSNLNKRQMRQRCPTARPLGTRLVENCRLVFRGVADIVHEEGCATPIGLWLINQPDERALDGYEGVHRGLYRKEQLEVEFNGKQRPALVYIMDSEGVYPPTQNYADAIRQGYKDFGLDTKHLDQAIAWAYEHKRPDQQTERRRSRQKVYNQRLVRMPDFKPHGNGYDIEVQRQALEHKLRIHEASPKKKRENLDDWLRRARDEGIRH